MYGLGDYDRHLERMREASEPRTRDATAAGVDLIAYRARMNREARERACRESAAAETLRRAIEREGAARLLAAIREAAGREDGGR